MEPFKASAIEDPSGAERPVRLNRLPDLCPVCQTAMLITGPTGKLVVDAHGNLQVPFICVSQTCTALFIAYYRPVGGEHFQSDGFCPTLPVTRTFGEVEEISPRFAEIYNQSISAESHGLTEICGMGLRKALEFLIKDYVISQGAERSAIEPMSLGKCIAEHVEDARIVACARRAAWLGNDETHYLRKWEERNVEDLKTLVSLTVNWIESDILTDRFVSEMPDTTKAS